MATSAFNIPIELNTTGAYTISELKEKLMAYAQMLVSMPKAHDVKKGDAKANNVHSAWVKSMEKYRVLNPIDDKEAYLEALDERFK